MPTRIPSRLIKNFSLKLEDMQPDFLEGQDWNITDGNNNATITGLRPGSNPNDVATVQNVLTQFDSLSFQNPVINMTTSDPSTLSPSEGDRYIVASGATGSWSGHDNQIAEYRNGSWGFIVPTEGYEVYDLDTNKFYVFNGSNWIDLSNYISGGGGTIPGNTGDVMWNNSGSLGADSNFNYDSSNQILKIGNLRFDGLNGRYYVDSGNLGMYIPDGQVLNMYFNNNLTYIISQDEINMNNHPIVNVPDPVNDQDVANKRYVDNAVNTVSYVFDSGIHEIGGSEVILGGQILYATIIDTNNQQFKIKNDQSSSRKPQIIFDSDYVAIGNMDNDNSGYGNIIRFLQDKIVIVSGPSNPSDGAGLYYDADYSSLNTNNDRWIPDWGTVKDYVDNTGGSVPGNDQEVILNVGGSFGTSPDIYADYNNGILVAKSYQASDNPSYLMSSYELQIKSGTSLSLRVNDVEMIGIDSNYVYNRTILDMTNHRIVNLADPTDNLDAVNLNYFNNHKFDAPGNDQQVIFNENGSLSTNANFTYDYTNDILQVGSILLDGNNAYVRSNYTLNLESSGSGYNLLLRVAGNTISEFDEYNQYLYRTLNMTHNQITNTGYLELDKGTSLVDFGGTALLNGILDVETQTDGNTYYSRLATLNIRKAVNSGINDNGYAVGFWVQSMPDSDVKAHEGYLRSEYGIQVQYGLYRSNHTGTIDRAVGIVISPYHQSGTINNSYGLWISAPSSGGTVGNYYPIYVTNNSGTVYLGSFTRINGNLDMINHQVKNVLDPTDNLDAVNLQYFNAHRLDSPGNDQEILFNNSGKISTDPNLTYDYSQNMLNVGSILLDQGEVRNNPGGVDLQFYTNNVKRMIIQDSTGYIAINKDSPEEYLDVDGYIKSSKGFIIKRTSFTVPASTQDYYRIATGVNRVGGKFRIRWNNSSQSGTLIFYASIHYGDATPYNLTLLNHDYYGSAGVPRIRLLEKGDSDTVYLDIQVNNANSSESLEVYVEQLEIDWDGWNVQDPPTGGATVPSGYSSRIIYVSGRTFRTPWHQLRTNGDLIISGYFRPGQSYKASDNSTGITATIQVLADDPGTAYVIEIKDGIVTSITSTTTTLT